jgi:hypothetical protein
VVKKEEKKEENVAEKERKYERYRDKKGKKNWI